MEVLAISGSLRRDSHNAELLRAAAQLLPPGAELVVWTGLREIPPYDADADGAPPPATSPLKGKPAAVIGASTGMFGAVWAQAEVRKVLQAIGARVLDRELPVPNADEAFGPGGGGLEPELREELGSMLDGLIAAGERASA